MQVNSTPQLKQPQALRFGGKSLLPTDIIKYAISKTSGINKPIAKFIQIREAPGGNMVTQFLQDTAILWVPKAVCSRSFLELFEVSFVEFIESGFFYFFPPLVGGKLFTPLIHKATGSKFARDLLCQPLKNTPQNLKKVVAPVKLGLAMVSLGLSTCSLYAMCFIKNLITEHKFKANEFSSVIGLDKKRVKKNGVESAVTKKAKRRLIQSAIGAVGVITASFAMAKWGHKLPTKTIQKLTDFCDYNFKAVRNKVTDKITHYKFDLGRNHLAIVMPFDILAYNDATRDKLEFVEVFSRTMITANYMAYFQPSIERMFYQWQGKSHRNLGIFSGPKLDSVANIHEVAKMSLAMAQNKLGANASTNALKQEATKLFSDRLTVKGRLFMGPFAFGILGIGMFTAMVNRFWTRYRFNVAQKLKKQNPRVYSHINPNFDPQALSVHYAPPPNTPYRFHVENVKYGQQPADNTFVYPNARQNPYATLQQ